MDGLLNLPVTPRTDLDRKGCGPTDRRLAQHHLEGHAARRVISVCSWCRRVRGEAGSWTPAERGLLEGAGLSLTHGLCPECARKHFPR